MASSRVSEVGPGSECKAPLSGGWLGVTGLTGAVRELDERMHETTELDPIGFSAQV